MPESALEVLGRRRMCRDFTDESIGEAVLDRILGAALGAPAAGNTHGLDLVVLRGSQTSLYWDVTLSPQRRAGFRWPGLLKAPVLVVPYVDPQAYIERYSEADKVRSGLGVDPDNWVVPYWFVDGGAAVMAMLTAAEALGLGALLFGQFDHESAVRVALGVPEHFRAVGTVALGHRRAHTEPSRSARRGRPEVAQHVHQGFW
jgi:nitroreductase